MTARGLYKFDSPSRIAAWLKNIAQTANQGTYGQAHFVDTTVEPDAGGARKDPAGGWYEVGGGSFSNLVIDSIFGAELTLHNGINVQSRVSDFFDAEARLEGLSLPGCAIYNFSHRSPPNRGRQIGESVRAWKPYVPALRVDSPRGPKESGNLCRHCRQSRICGKQSFIGTFDL